MNHTLFISDLHLEPDRPDITSCFLMFLKEYVTKADALYILGDLFEAWTGDDVSSEFTRNIQDAIRAANVPVYFMRGNRDFLIGNDFANKTNTTLLADPFKINLYGTAAVLCHGDSLCTDDVKHQNFRKYAHNPKYNRYFLMLPAFLRQKIARMIRKASQRHTQKVAANIMDVNNQAVASLMDTQQSNLLIHGHTHRPAIHNHTTFTRIVLGDWHEKGSALVYKANGEFELINFGD